MASVGSGAFNDSDGIDLYCKCGHSEQWHELTPESDPPRFDCILGGCSCADFDLDDDEMPELTAEQLKRARPHWEWMAARAFIQWIGRFK